MDIAVDLNAETTGTLTLDPVSLSLPAELGIYAAAEVYRDMTSVLDALAAHPEQDALHIDAHRVDMLDASGVQLLVAFTGELHGRGISVQWVAPSRTLRDSAQRLGVSGVLHLHADAPVA
jgi:ABC-type transporter Mla MlaB component